MFGNIQPIMKKIDYIEKFYTEFFNMLKSCNLEKDNDIDEFLKTL